MAKKPLETLLALKAICLQPGLSSNERRVGAALIEHYNRRTGQCDPGLGRLARLLGINKRTVIRSIHGLESDELFEKVRHGGRSGRNFYLPNWLRFQEICAAWNQLLKKRSSLQATELSSAGGQNCHLGDDSSGDQTYKSNLHKPTCNGLPTEKKTKASSHDAAPPPANRSRPSREVLEMAALRRWTTALHERFASTPVIYAEILDLITPALQSDTTAAEIANRGTGLDCLLDRLRVADRSQAHMVGKDAL